MSSQNTFVQPTLTAECHQSHANQQEMIAASTSNHAPAVPIHQSALTACCTTPMIPTTSATSCSSILRGENPEQHFPTRVEIPPVAHIIAAAKSALHTKWDFKRADPGVGVGFVVVVAHHIMAVVALVLLRRLLDLLLSQSLLVPRLGSSPLRGGHPQHQHQPQHRQQQQPHTSKQPEEEPEEQSEKPYPNGLPGPIRASSVKTQSAKSPKQKKKAAPSKEARKTPAIHSLTVDFVISTSLQDAHCLLSEVLPNPHRSFLFINQLKAFPNRFEAMHLSEGGRRIFDTPNAGGQSVRSEVLTFEMLRSCFQADLLRTEMEIDYFPFGGKKTDMAVRIGGHKLGVSVTRAMNGAHPHFYSAQDARSLLEKKLLGVIYSTRNSLMRWKRQILHVWAPSKAAARTVRAEYRKLPKDLRINTVVIVTVTKCEWIFNEGSTLSALWCSSSSKR